MSQRGSSADALAGLSPRRKSQIEALIQEQIRLAMGSVTITTVNSNIDPPEYDSDRMTSDTFFRKCTDYLHTQGFRESEYHQVISTILKGDMRLWYDNVASSVKSWSDFCSVFRSRYDSIFVQERRKKVLYTREQKINEPVEQFVYEMINLGKQINPNEAEELSVYRALNALVPELRLAIGDIKVKTANNLIEAANKAIEAIRERDERNGTTTALPEVYGFMAKQDDMSQPHDNSQFRSRSHSFPSRLPEVQCYICSEWGHYARECNAAAGYSNDVDDEDDAFGYPSEYRQ